MFDILKKIKQYVTLKKLIDTLERLQKERTFDDLLNALRLKLLMIRLTKIIENWDKRNQIFLIMHYLRLWNVKAKKIKERDDALEEALKRINDKRIQNDTKTLIDTFLIKKINHDILSARALEFLKRLKQTTDKNKKFTDLSETLIKSRDSLLKDNTNNLVNAVYKVYHYIKIKKLIKKIEDLQKILALRKLFNAGIPNKFCELYKKFAKQKMLNPERELFDLLKSDSLFKQALGDNNLKLYLLLRKYFIRKCADVMEGSSRLYRLLYLIKLVLMHKTIAYQRFVREMIRRWRFSSFIQNMARRKLELLYKNLHVSYLQVANEVFGDKGVGDASVVKEFERFSNKIGTFVNENYQFSYEANFCENINKKYIFQPVEMLMDKEGPSHLIGISGSGGDINSIDLNEDYYVDQDLVGETVGKYKSETNKSASRFAGTGKALKPNESKDSSRNISNAKKKKY